MLKTICVSIPTKRSEVRGTWRNNYPVTLLHLFHADPSEAMSAEEKTWIKIEKTDSATLRLAHLARGGRSSDTGFPLQLV